MTEILNLNALCRCCFANGNFSDLNSTCDIMGYAEIFTDILKDTFGIHLHSPSINVSNTICNQCIKHLRDGAIFKKQVLDCEKKFQEYCKNELLQNINIKLEKGDGNNGVMAKMEITLKDERENVLDNDETVSDNDAFISDNEIVSDNEYEMKNGILTIDVKIEPQHSNQENNASEEHNEERCRKPKDQSTTQGFRHRKNVCEYLCKLCKMSFTNKQLLKEHKSENHNPLHICKICNIRFKRNTTYNKHMFNHSICVTPTIPLAEITTFDCKMCNKSYNTINKLREHRNIHTRDKVYICDLCKKEFVYKNSIRKHILWHTGRNKQYMCDTCGNSFNDITNLNKHIITVHEKLKLFKCTLCSKEFAANKTLKVHMRLHTGERPYKCDMCEKAFINSKNLANHKSKHEMKINFGGIYICKICKAPFDHRGLYTTHLRTHLTAKLYKCTQCSEDFTTGYSLRRHMETHISVKNYSCDKCDRKFTTTSKLRCHGKYHDPRRIKKVKIEKINCKLCKKSVTDINKHMKAHYNRRHQCDFCDKSYSERNTMNRHIKQCHDGIRHECDVCEKSFVNTSSLKTHKIKYHNIKIMKNKVEEE